MSILVSSDPPSKAFALNAMYIRKVHVCIMRIPPAEVGRRPKRARTTDAPLSAIDQTRRVWNDAGAFGGRP